MDLFIVGEMIPEATKYILNYYDDVEKKYISIAENSENHFNLSEIVDSKPHIKNNISRFLVQACGDEYESSMSDTITIDFLTQHKVIRNYLCNDEAVIPTTESFIQNYTSLDFLSDSEVSGYELDYIEVNGQTILETSFLVTGETTITYHYVVKEEPMILNLEYVINKYIDKNAKFADWPVYSRGGTIAILNYIPFSKNSQPNITSSLSGATFTVYRYDKDYNFTTDIAVTQYIRVDIVLGTSALTGDYEDEWIQIDEVQYTLTNKVPYHTGYMFDETGELSPSTGHIAVDKIFYNSETVMRISSYAIAGTPIYYDSQMNVTTNKTAPFVKYYFKVATSLQTEEKLNGKIITDYLFNYILHN